MSCQRERLYQNGFFLKKRSNYILSTGNTPYPKIKSKRMEKYTSYKLTTESRSG